MISIVICTRDRALTLQRCLRNIAAIDHSPLQGWEIIVIDNGSRDKTRAVAESFSPSLPLRYVSELAPGLSHARNRGVAEARNSTIAFTDDDCLITPGWASKIVRAFAQDPSLSIIGGRVVLADAEDSPIGVRCQRTPSAVTNAGQILEFMIGCNFAFKRSVFDAAGMFDTSFGAGTRVGSAEDVDILYRALKLGMRIEYRPEVVVLHAHGRKTPEPGHAEQYIRGRGAFYCKHIREREILQLAYWEIMDGVRRLRENAPPHVLRSLAKGVALRILGPSS